MAASQVVAVPSWLDVKRASVAPQEHRVDHRSGRSLETCEISLRSRVLHVEVNLHFCLLDPKISTITVTITLRLSWTGGARPPG